MKRKEKVAGGVMMTMTMTIMRDGKAKKTFWRRTFAGKCRGRAPPLEETDFLSLALKGDRKTFP